MDISNQKKYTEIEKEAIRKHWLYTYFASIVMFCLSLIVQAVQSPDPFLKYKTSIKIGNVTYHPIPLIWIILFACFFAGSFYLIYHFAYKKRGTKWLFFVMSMRSAYFVVNFVSVMKFFREIVSTFAYMDLNIIFLNVSLSIYNIALLLVSGYFILASSRLYRLNRTLKK